jgi:hypothetical protein
MQKPRRGRKKPPSWGKFPPASFPPQSGSLDPDEVWLNDYYQVLVTFFDCEAMGVKGMRWLSIKRIDRKPIHDWRELQLIKNELCGKDFEAVELYPSETRVNDTANQYHLFVLPKGMVWPFGYFEREVSELSSQGSVQRPFAPHVVPPDLLTPEQVAERECRPLPRKMIGISCDWGGCDLESVALRYSSEKGWLPVCPACKLKGISK